MKRALLRSILFFIVVSQPLLSLAEEIDLTRDLVGNGEVNVPLAAFDAFLNRSPIDGQINLLNDEERLKEVVARYYYDRMIANDARALELDKEPVNKARIDALVDRELTQIRKIEMDSQPVPDMTKLAEEYYKANRDEFKRDDQVRMAHIMIGYAKHSANEAREIAEEILQELKQGGDFSAILEARSEDPSAKHNQGDLGWRERGEFVKNFADAAFALKSVGELSSVIQTKFGFHIIKLLDKRAAQVAPYDEVREQVIGRMESDYKNNRWVEYLDKIRNEYEVGIEQKLLDAYRKDRLERLIELKRAMAK
ncbi:MAG: peptidylprolyl isomerase [Candidatus Thiodiazotropha sp.]